LISVAPFPPGEHFEPQGFSLQPQTENFPKMQDEGAKGTNGNSKGKKTLGPIQSNWWAQYNFLAIPIELVGFGVDPEEGHALKGDGLYTGGPFRGPVG
jgi:hypothetical protein